MQPFIVNYYIYTAFLKRWFKSILYIFNLCAISGSGISDLDLPQKYRRKPIEEEEIAYILVGTSLRSELCVISVI